jgi:hypothetical protein
MYPTLVGCLEDLYRARQASAERSSHTLCRAVHSKAAPPTEDWPAIPRLAPNGMASSRSHAIEVEKDRLIAA